MYKVFSIIIILFSLNTKMFTQVNEFKILPSTGSVNDYFGRSVSIDGEYAIIGASGGDKAFIFKRSGSNWTEQEILSGINNPSGSILGPLFGYSVCVLGDYAIVGAPFQVVPPILNYIGSAYIFKRDGEDWIFQQTITPPVAHPFGLFGWSVAISNSFAIIGETDQNTVHIYRRIGENWQPDTIIQDGWRLGEVVAISGNYISLGTPGGSIWNTDGQGSAYIYSNDGINWIQQAMLQASDGTDFDEFGEALSLSGTVLLAGDSEARNNDSLSTGAAYIFIPGNTSWVENQKLTAGDGSLGDLFGYSVSISGNYAVVSAPGDQDMGINSGSAYIFMNDGSNWIETQKLLASDGMANDNFGTAVSISGNYIIVGANWDDDNGSNSGSAYIYYNFITDIKNEQFQKPAEFNLSQNYPNPFNPSTKINYQLPKTGFVTLKIYDVLGNEVTALVNEEKPAGSYEIEFDATNLSSGIYFYKIQAGDFVETRKMIFIK